MSKALTFVFFVWCIVTIAGNVLMGDGPMVATRLTAPITAAESTSIPVSSTQGFPTPGIIVIGDERIGYSSKTATAFTHTVASPMVRGAQSTTAAAHVTGSVVRTVENSMMNQSTAYNVAVVADASGLWAAVTVGLAILRLLGNFVFLPLSFLGTDLQLIGYVWVCVSLGLLIVFGLALAGSRRV